MAMNNPKINDRLYRMNIDKGESYFVGVVERLEKDRGRVWFKDSPIAHELRHYATLAYALWVGCPPVDYPGPEEQEQLVFDFGEGGVDG